MDDVMHKKLFLTIIVICLFGLTACGQTGALYLPGQKHAAHSSQLP